MIRLLVTAIICLGCLATFAEEKPSPEPQAWSGKIAEDALRKLAPKSGFLTDAKSFEKLWNAWRPDEALPEVDFDKQLVLIGTVNGPNLIIMNPSLNEKGNLTFLVGGTKIGGPGFGYKVMLFNREGVKSVNGTPVDAPPAKDSITVRVVGKLQTGVFAIGGETTGTMITANGITWELDFGDNEKLRKEATSLNGQQVRVRGTLERKRGVEIKERWIVTVTKLQAAQ